MKIVHVYQQRIRANIKAEPKDRKPPIIIRHKKKRTYANEIEIKGPSTIRYSADKPLDCGARLWIEVPDETDIVVIS